jgi:hypothetical protein
VIGAIGAADYSVLDPTGAEKWRARIVPATQLSPWISGVPWLPIVGTTEISPSDHYVAVQPSWFGWVGGDDFAFSIFKGRTALEPITVQVIRNGDVLAAGALSNEISYDLFSAWPFVAGEGNHVVLVGQSWRQRGTCFAAPSIPWVARIDAKSMSQCPLAVPDGTLSIARAALIPNRVVVGGLDILGGCEVPVRTIVIAAFEVAGESLADSGWVQSNGNPGLGLRRQTH